MIMLCTHRVHPLCNLPLVSLESPVFSKTDLALYYPVHLNLHSQALSLQCFASVFCIASHSSRQSQVLPFSLFFFVCANPVPRHVHLAFSYLFFTPGVYCP